MNANRLHTDILKTIEALRGINFLRDSNFISFDKKGSNTYEISFANKKN